VREFRRKSRERGFLTLATFAVLAAAVLAPIASTLLAPAATAGPIGQPEQPFQPPEPTTPPAEPTQPPPEPTQPAGPTEAPQPTPEPTSPAVPTATLVPTATPRPPTPEPRETPDALGVSGSGSAATGVAAVSALPRTGSGHDQAQGVDPLLLLLGAGITSAAFTPLIARRLAAKSRS
jgi:hypothetical protein